MTVTHKDSVISVIDSRLHYTGIRLKGSESLIRRASVGKTQRRGTAPCHDLSLRGEFADDCRPLLINLKSQQGRPSQQKSDAAVQDEEKPQPDL